MVTAVFVVTALVIIAGAGFALAGRWAPDGHSASTAPMSDADSLDGTDDPAFDVVLRGYRMDQVDAYIAQLQRRSAEAASRADGETPARRGAATDVGPQT